MNLLKPMLSGALLASRAVVGPLKGPSAARRSLPKRISPTIDPGFTDQEKTQLSDGFKNALELAAFVVSAIDADNDRKDIFNKYFNEDDRRPLNPDATGSHILGGISIKEDFPTGGDLYRNDDDVIAQLRNYGEDNPTLIMCPDIRAQTIFPPGLHIW
ncbi:putative Lysine-specific metallo-endopeptidase domain-containing protein [Seiridium cardinale]|uniref:Lysine-specific metallo-endopeptidase domain-containing protein n=1 Tax=Seiridium cardinale TaxID=138064 RepID=A0ABR2X8V9_9PEZI